MRRLKSPPKIYRLGVRFPKTVLFVALLLSVLSFCAARKLELVTDLTALLPKHAESVQSLEKVKKYFGGTSFLILTVEGDSKETAQDFADQFILQLQKLSDIRHVEYRQPVEFFKERQWLYLTLEDLEKIQKRIVKILELQGKGISPVFNSFLGFADKEDQPTLDFDDILQKYKKRIGFKNGDHLSDDEGRFIVLKAETKSLSENIGFSRRLIQNIHLIENDLKKENRFQGVQIGYTGDHQAAIEETDLLQKEISRVSLAVTLVLLLVLLLYFKRWSAPILIGLPLALSILWTGALVYLILGHLNLVTGFAAAILGGLGSDYGIYLLTRYYHERESGTPFAETCDLTFANTGRATYTSMITTVGSFIALLFSHFGVFVELGFVGAIGLWMNYLTMMLILPSLLTLMERWKKPRTVSKEWRFLDPWKSVIQLHSHFLSHRSSLITLLLVVLLCGVSAISLRSQTNIQFEDGQLDTQSLPGNKLWKKVDRVVQASLSPTFILADGAEKEKAIVRGLEELLDKKNSSEIVFNNVVGLSTFLPDQQTEKKAILNDILKDVSRLKIVLKKKKETLVDSLKKSLEASPASLENLPDDVKRKFISSHDKNYFGIYLFPSFGRSDSESIRKYYEGVESLKKQIGINFVAADSSFVTHEVIRVIQKEASKGFVLILLFFLGVLFYSMHSFKRAFLIFLNLIGSLLVLSGILSISGLHLNILNIAVVPIVLGTGIDCFVHFSHHYEECGDMKKTLHTEIPAMFISSFTSIIGFTGLLFTSSAGLRSVGWVAVLGLTLVTFFSAFVFPRCLVLETKRKTAAVQSFPEDIADM